MAKTIILPYLETKRGEERPHQVVYHYGEAYLITLDKKTKTAIVPEDAIFPIYRDQIDNLILIVDITKATPQSGTFDPDYATALIIPKDQWCICHRLGDMYFKPANEDKLYYVQDRTPEIINYPYE
jgi:hypothetical protein